MIGDDDENYFEVTETRKGKAPRIFRDSTRENISQSLVEYHRRVGNTWTQEKAVSEFIKVHGDKYDFSKVDYQGFKQKVTVICPKHGEWKASVQGLLQGNECKKCSIDKKRNTDRNRKHSEFLEKSKLVHGDKYDYSKFVYVDRLTKVTIICPKHGEFQKKPHRHITGSGCQKCLYESRKIELDEELLFQLFQEGHSDWTIAKKMGVNTNTIRKRRKKT